MSCAFCGISARKKCSSCREVAYCSRRCQRDDWPRHKRWCDYHRFRGAVRRLRFRRGAMTYLTIVFALFVAGSFLFFRGRVWLFAADGAKGPQLSLEGESEAARVISDEGQTEATFGIMSAVVDRIVEAEREPAFSEAYAVFRNHIAERWKNKVRELAAASRMSLGLGPDVESFKFYVRALTGLVAGTPVYAHVLFYGNAELPDVFVCKVLLSERKNLSSQPQLVVFWERDVLVDERFQEAFDQPGKAGLSGREAPDGSRFSLGFSMAEIFELSEPDETVDWRTGEKFYDVPSDVGSNISEIA